MIKSVVLSPYGNKKDYSLQIEGRWINCGQGIKGASVFPLDADDLRILVDEITAQLEAIEKGK